MSQIINADDFGYSPSVNHAISMCFDRGYIQRTTIMTNMPYFNEAVRIADDGNFKEKVGLHLVLDEFTPLTDEIKKNPKFCKNGVFIKGWFASIRNKIYLSCYDRKCLKEEIEAQMQAYCNSGFSMMHLDSHHLVHTSSPLIFNIVKNLALKYGFVSMRNVAIYPHDNIVRRVVKMYIRHVIERYFYTTKFFAAYCNYTPGLVDIEYMSHPDMYENRLVDFLDRKSKLVTEFDNK